MIDHNMDDRKQRNGGMLSTGPASLSILRESRMLRASEESFVAVFGRAPVSNLLLLKEIALPKTDPGVFGRPVAMRMI